MSQGGAALDPGKDLILVYPPFVATSVNGPHLALGVLRSYLAGKGMSVSTWDGNIRFVRWLLDPERFGPPVAALRELFRSLDALPDLSPDQYFALRHAARAFQVDSALADAVRGEDESSFAALARVLAIVHGESLAGIPRSVEAVVEATGAEGHDSSILSRFLAEQDPFFGEAARRSVVGINVSFSEQLYGAALVAREIQRRAGGRRPLVLLGGTQISLLAQRQIEDLCRLPFVDGVVLHEGERPLELVLERTRKVLAAGGVPLETDLSGLPNLCTRTNPSPASFAEAVPLGDLPAPEFDPEEVRLYFAPLVLPLYVTKGCYWGKCSFCDYTRLYAPSPDRWLERDVERVVADVKELMASHAATTFQLISEAVPPRWYRRFARAVLQEKLHLRFFSYLKNERAGVLTQEFFDLLSAAGVKCLVCGVESPVDRLLAVVGKGVKGSDVAANFRMMAAAGIRGICNLIPDFPSTRIEEAEEALGFVCENADAISSVTCQFFDLSGQSAIARSPGAFGLTVEEGAFLDSSHGCHSLPFRHDSLTPEQQVWLRAAFPAAAAEVARYHRTRDVLRALEHPGFDWSRAAFVFSRFDRVLTRYPMPPPWLPLGEAPPRVQAGSERIWLGHRSIESETLLPMEMLPVVERMEQRALVSFRSLARSVPDTNDLSLVDSLLGLARLGFIEKVLAGGALVLPRQLRAMSGGRDRTRGPGPSGEVKGPGPGGRSEAPGIDPPR